MRTILRHQTRHNATLISVAAIAVITNVLLLQRWNVNHVSGFLNVVPQQVQKLSSSSSSFSPLSRIILQQQLIDDNEDDDVFLTPIQIRTIRKDIIRKRANQKLPTIYYNNNNQESSMTTISDDNDASSDIVTSRSVEQQIIDVLISEQLVQVRGIALQDTDTRTIRNEAEQLAYRIQKQIQQQQQQENSLVVSSQSSLAYVFVVEMKGHMATLFYYNPQQQLTTPFRRQHQTTTAVLSSVSSSSSSNTASTSSRLPKVQLRTTGKRNDWNKRPKALRDNAGRIIK